MVNSFNIKNGANVQPTSNTASAKGDIVCDSTTGNLKTHNGTVAASVVTDTNTLTLTNKTFDASLNTLSNIVDAYIASGAAIARTKIAAGTASHVIINDGSGVLSSESTLALTRGGTASSTGSITGSGALTFAAGGSNQNVAITPSGTGFSLLSGKTGIGVASPAMPLDVNLANGERLYVRSSSNGATTTYGFGLYDGSNLISEIFSSNSNGTKDGSLAGHSGIAINSKNVYANSQVVLGMGNVSALLVDSNRKIGIGTTIPQGALSVSPLQYSTGTIGQSTNTVTGVGTTFTSAMVGSQLVYATGTNGGTITAFNSTTSLTVSSSQTVSTGSVYSIFYTGLQAGTTGLVGIGTISPALPLDVSGSARATNMVNGYTTTATAAGTTTLTSASTGQQYFTGSTTQTVVLPVVTTLVNGLQYVVENLSSGVVTVQTSGSNTIQALAANTSLTVTCVDTTAGTGTASWNASYQFLAPYINPMTTGGDLIYGGASGVQTRLANGTAGQVLSSNGTTAAPTWITNNPVAPTGEVVVDTPNGFGSTNTKIVRFTNTRVNTGSDITYADSATNGGSFTINTAGIYSTTISAQANVGISNIFITVNDSNLASGSPGTYAQGFRTSCLTSSGGNGTTSWVGHLAVNDVVRMHTDATGLAASNQGAFMSVVRIA